MIVAFNTYSTNDKSDLVFGGLIATLDDTHSSFYNYVETFITKKHVSNTIHAVFLSKHHVCQSFVCKYLVSM